MHFPVQKYSKSIQVPPCRDGEAVVSFLPSIQNNLTPLSMLMLHYSSSARTKRRQTSFSDSSPPNHITKAFHQLHRIPVAYIIKFKVAPLVFLTPLSLMSTVHWSSCQTYEQRAIQLNVVSHRLLGWTQMYLLPQLRPVTDFSSVTGAVICNSSSGHAYLTDIDGHFSRLLKVHYFRLHFQSLTE